MSIKKHLYFSLSLIWAFIWDISSKYWALGHIDERVYLIGNIMYFDIFKNPGIAFSIPLTGIVLKIVTIVLILGLFGYYLSQEAGKKNLYIDIAFGMILGWALWNAIERIYFESVTDFIGVTHFAVMNFADICISLGAILYLWDSIFRKK